VIDEARRAYTEISLFEIAVDAVVMNRLLPEDAGREEFFRERYALEAERRQEVEALFAPLPVLMAPLRDDEVTGVERLAVHGRELFATVDPDAVLCQSARVTYDRDGAGVVATLPLPGADIAHLDVVKVEDELTITVGLRRRIIVLPRSVANLEVESAALQDGALKIRFAAPEGATANGDASSEGSP
jgi:arsenite-transporting ATPase